MCVIRKLQAENDTDKFLCYSCNNWLINWWSLQHKNDQGNNQPHSSSNSPSKSERNRNEKRYTSKTEKENEQRRPNFPVEGVVGKLRPVLADLAHQNAEVIVSSTTNDNATSPPFQLKRRQKPYAKKYKCSYCKSRFMTSSMRREHLSIVHHETEAAKYRLVHPNNHVDGISSDIIDANIVEMLRKQGTLITLEDKKHPTSHFKPKRNCGIQTDTTKNTFYSNTNDEILLSFDSVITEAIMASDTLNTYLMSTNGLFVSP